MTELLHCISPIDDEIYQSRPVATADQISAMMTEAARAQRHWQATPLDERQRLLSAFVDRLLAERDTIAEEITRQMGRPISASPGELRGFEERARYMIDIAPAALADVRADDKAGFTRFIRREPLGVILVVAPWNFPYLTAVNSVVPALLAGNSVVLKHSAQTPLCGERFARHLAEAGLPEGVFQVLHTDHDGVAAAIAAPQVGYVVFTGSVAGGRAVQHAASKRFIATGLELGGKDPAYVRADADLDYAIAGLVDGAFFNSGQSCCGIERIYVDRSVYQHFVDGFVSQVNDYRLGNPLDPDTTLGPLVRAKAAEFVRLQIAEAIHDGASALIDTRQFKADCTGSTYMAPQVLVDVDHRMRVMTEESFGPVVGIMAVDSDEQAIELMNDSEYGLTASVWTGDEAAALAIGDRIDTGTWFMNRCDYLDPALAWVGVKNSGRGCSLSSLGYEALTRPKSYHLKTSL